MVIRVRVHVVNQEDRKYDGYSYRGDLNEAIHDANNQAKEENGSFFLSSLIVEEIKIENF